MASNLNINIRIICLVFYVLSLPLGTIQVLQHVSIPFLVALGFGALKMYEMLLRPQKVSIRLEVFAVIVLYTYLVGAEYFLHKATVLNNYFISFGLNCVMLMLLVDEFHQSLYVRRKIMLIYVIGMVSVAVLVSLTIFTSSTETGRLTFLGLNQNELAAGLLIAYCWISTRFMGGKVKRFETQGVMMLAAIFTLNALIVTGTRFALVGVIAVMLLMTFLVIFERNNLRPRLTYIFTGSIFFIYKVLSFAPTAERVITATPANNLKDFGGRVPLWNNSIDAFNESPLIGLGYSGFENLVLSRGMHFDLPHNFLLEILAIAGLAGVLLLTFIAITIFWRLCISRDFAYLVYRLIWCVPLIIILLMINVSNLKIFWFLLAYYITFNLSERALIR